MFDPPGLASDGEVRLGTKVPETGPGVYVVALANEPDGIVLPLDKCPISTQAVKLLLETRPELRIDGKRPDASAKVPSNDSAVRLPEPVKMKTITSRRYPRRDRASRCGGSYVKVPCDRVIPSPLPVSGTRDPG